MASLVSESIRPGTSKVFITWFNKHKIITCKATPPREAIKAHLGGRILNLLLHKGAIEEPEY